MRDGDGLDNNPQVSRSALADMHDQVFGWAMSRCDFNRSVAEDLVQQTYVELLTGKARFDGRSTLRTFVFGIVQNLSRSRYRRLATRMRLVRLAAHEQQESVQAAPEIDDCMRIWSAVQDLPQRQRDVIELVFCREMTIEEAAAVMGVATGTGRQHYDRAKKALKKKLSGAFEHAG